MAHEIKIILCVWGEGEGDERGDSLILNCVWGGAKGGEGDGEDDSLISNCIEKCCCYHGNINFCVMLVLFINLCFSIWHL